MKIVYLCEQHLGIQALVYDFNINNRSNMLLVEIVELFGPEADDNESNLVIK